MNKKEKMVKSFDLLYESWQVYAKNLLKFIEVFIYGLIGMVPMFVLLLLFYAYNVTGSGNLASLGTKIVLGFIGIILFGVSLYYAIVYSLRAKVAGILLLKNNFTSARENFKASKPYVKTFLGVSLLTVVLVIAWGFVFLIPALVFGIYYGFASYILVLEDRRPFTSVERSYDLVKGYFWPVFGRLAFMSLIVIIIYALISIPMSGMVIGSAPYIAYNVFTNIIWVVLSPYFIIYFYQIYQSLNKVNK